MDLCSLEDAFPNIEPGSLLSKGKSVITAGVGAGAGGAGSAGYPYAGCTDDKPSREERRAARKKAKRMKGPAAAYQAQIQKDLPPTDPDRPALKRVEAIEAMTSGSVKLYAPPPGQQADLPVLPKASCLFSDAGYPSYFGKGEDDDPVEEEGFSDYVNTVGDDPSFRLVPDFTKVFDFKGLEKAAGGGLSGSLPEPNLDDNWKGNERGATYTAYVSEGAGERAEAESLSWSADSLREDGGGLLAAPSLWGSGGRGRGRDQGQQRQETVQPQPAQEGSQGRVVPSGGNPAEDRDKLLARIDMLMGRLEQLEKKKEQGNQNELLFFVGTGLFLLASFNFVGRGC